MLLVSLSIIAASIDRFPNSWRFYSRPEKNPDSSFRRALHPQKSIPISDWRERLGGSRARHALHGAEAGAGCPRRSLRDFRRAPSHLRNGRLHRSRQPAPDFLRLDHRWGLWMARNLETELGADDQSGRVARRLYANAAVCHSLRRCWPGNYKDGSPKKWW